jgi:hypothetical protein
MSSQCFFPSRLPTNILYAFLICPMRATHSGHLILFDLITPITLGEAYKLWSSTLCCSLLPPPPFQVHNKNNKSNSNMNWQCRSCYPATFYWRLSTFCPPLYICWLVVLLQHHAKSLQSCVSLDTKISLYVITILLHAYSSYSHVFACLSCSTNYR